MVRRDLRRAEPSVACRRMPIKHKHHRIAKGKRTPRRRINTEVALEPADYELVDSVMVKQALQLSVVKRIETALPDSQIAHANNQAISKSPSGRAVNKRPVISLVLNEYNKCPRSSGLRSHKINSFNHARCFEHFQLA